jgi:hypothetical protein
MWFWLLQIPLIIQLYKICKNLTQYFLAPISVLLFFFLIAFIPFYFTVCVSDANISLFAKTVILLWFSLSSFLQFGFLVNERNWDVIQFVIANFFVNITILIIVKYLYMP